MLAKPVARSSAGAREYYYKTEGHNNTEWGGRGADQLGLKCEIRSQDFENVAYGKHPHDSNISLRRTAGKDSGRAGWDFTFSLSKNASILAFQDRRILDAFKQSVNETLKIAEQRYAQTRRVENNTIKTEKTNNLVYAKFTHYNSRANDPQIHTHVLVMNTTQGTDGKWRALDNRELYSNYKHIGLIQEHILANKLRELGYKLEIDRKTGIVDIKTERGDIKEFFSKRSEQIKQAYEQQYKDQFKHERDAKQKATWETREEKDHNFTYSEMKEKVSNDLKQNFNVDLKELRDQSLAKEQAQTLSRQELDEIVKDSIKDVTQTQSAFTHEQLESLILKRTLDKNVSFNDIQKSIDSQSDLVKLNEKYYTTKEIQQIERDTVEKIKDNPKTESLMDKEKAEEFIKERELANGFRYTDGQKEFIEKALTNKEKYLIVQGNAGSGKTASIEAINKAYVSEGYRVIGIAPTGKATNLLRDAGIQETYTVAKFKQEIKSGNLQVNSKTVIITDEASMVSSRDMHFVVNQNAGKTILVGDVKQFKPIEQGKIFEDIQKNVSKDNFVDMQETVRFKTESQKEVAELMNKGKYEEAVERLDQQGNIKEIQDQNEKLEQIKNDYIKHYEAGKDTIIITNTNKEREILNNEIRHELQDKGYISRQDYKIDTYSQRNLTDAEKNFSENYQVNDKVIFHSKYKGEGYIKEIDKENNKLTIEFRDGTTKQVDASELKNASVYQHEEKNFAEGDKVIFLKNDRGLNIANGETGKVIDINEDRMTIQKDVTGERVTINTNTQANNSYNYIDHAYAVTNYKAQGQTTDVTIYSHNSQTITNQQSFYVASTRAREQTTIYTDNKQALKEQVQQEQQKLSTRDFEEQKQETKAEQQHEEKTQETSREHEHKHEEQSQEQEKHEETETQDREQEQNHVEKEQREEQQEHEESKETRQEEEKQEHEEQEEKEQAETRQEEHDQEEKQEQEEQQEEQETHEQEQDHEEKQEEQAEEEQHEEQQERSQEQDHTEEKQEHEETERDQEESTKEELHEEEHIEQEQEEHQEEYEDQEQQEHQEEKQEELHEEEQEETNIEQEHTEEEQESEQYEEVQEQEQEDEYLQQHDIEQLEEDIYSKYEEFNEIAREEQQEEYQEEHEETAEFEYEREEEQEQEEEQDSIDVDISR